MSNTNQSKDLPSRESRMVVLQRDESGAPTVWCDPEIADLIRALNSGGVPTVASCSGHGEKPGWVALKDGRQLAIVPDLDAFKRLIANQSKEEGSFSGGAEAEYQSWIPVMLDYERCRIAIEKTVEDFFAERPHLRKSVFRGTARRWVERWYGSGPDRGWSIWAADHGDRIAYVGEGEHSERLTSLIVEKHNATLSSQSEAR